MLNVIDAVKIVGNAPQTIEEAEKLFEKKCDGINLSGVISPSSIFCKKVLELCREHKVFPVNMPKQMFLNPNQKKLEVFYQKE